MTHPRALKPGDRVAIVSPASPIVPENLEPGLAKLRAWGLEPVLMPHALDQDFYLAGTDAGRAQDLMDAFLDPQFAAVICSRGGYGCARLMPHLDLDALAQSGKLFVGFSDVTTLHLALNRRGLITFHAPMLLTWVKERPSWVEESWRQALMGGDPLQVGAPAARTVVSGCAEGLLTGGCLCLLTDSLATPDALDARGRLVLIEDVDENPHRVDAMLTHLMLSGALSEAAGLVIGEMTGTDSRADATIGSKPWREIVIERLGPLGLPMVIDFPMGHAEAMLSIPLGVRARLDADAGTLTLLESPCAASSPV
ncbi:MAG TPA: LD-carboxypeptidase [Fimbriimonadaceae bacterium]|nr:LD-carboxypeptidase [Fimbriimonadaceae bacterium]HRJ33163.1 LD-carboxypeptidase [Fimbriimonadaceae bacterium]